MLFKLEVLVRVAIALVFIVPLINLGFFTENPLMPLIIFAGIVLLIKKQPLKYFYHLMIPLFLLNYLVDIYVYKPWESAFDLDCLLPLFFVYCGLYLTLNPIKKDAKLQEWVFIAIGGFFSSLLKGFVLFFVYLKFSNYLNDKVLFLFAEFSLALIAALVFYFFAKNPLGFISILERKTKSLSIGLAVLALLVGTWFFISAIEFIFYQMTAVFIIYIIACLRSCFATGSKNTAALFLLMGNSFGLFVMVYRALWLAKGASLFVLISVPLYIFLFIGIFAAMSLASGKNLINQKIAVSETSN